MNGISRGKFRNFTSFFNSLIFFISRTILSSVGNDGRVRLWKATSGNVWRPAGSVGVEQTEEPNEPEHKDVEMDA